MAKWQQGIFYAIFVNQLKFNTQNQQQFPLQNLQKDVKMDNFMKEVVFDARCYFISHVTLLFLVLYCLTLIVTCSLTLGYCLTQALSSYSFKDTFQYNHWFFYHQINSTQKK